MSSIYQQLDFWTLIGIISILMVVVGLAMAVKEIEDSGIPERAERKRAERERAERHAASRRLAWRAWVREWFT